MSDILIILVLILLNGVFAMSELALVSAKRLRLERRAEEGSRGARTAIALADSPSHFLSTVQVGITLIGIFTGAFGEASLVQRLRPQIEAIGIPADYAYQVSLFIVVLGITFVSIVLGELVPKRIAMRYPDAMATLIAPPLSLLSKIMAPFVKILSFSTEVIVRLLGIREAKEEAPTEEDITGMIKEGADTGLFEKTEYDIVSRALRLDDRHLKALMTPRVDLVLIDLDADRREILELVADNTYSRFPVYRGDRAQIIGFISVRDLLAQAVKHGSLEAVNIDAAIQPLLYVPETVSAMVLLESFKKNSSELALIVDEYGDIQGMVTLSDVMSALVGDVTVIGEEHDPDAVQRQDGSWLLDGGIDLDRFRDLMGSGLRFPDEDNGAYHTLAGFVLYQLGYIPKPSEFFEWGEFRFEVVDMDGNRIDRILVARMAAQEPAQPAA
ncbi:hemolysin family protein [Massilia sp. YIM B02443]|uniref:hemolysin family protein n=1 Tax=Massilia sp. YIM B02443 TaxID=3050127 RepID=UPI0025B6799C|nr:hemolysin family protein [Massilia sp. YIM B02443]MDN4039379.1 hemolysin family protein [Massilia sp. YIM B02443]